MERVGIRAMRQNLSRYAQRARQGEVFLLTDRGVEVAQLGPAPAHASAIDRLVAERGARRGDGNLLALLPRPRGAHRRHACPARRGDARARGATPSARAALARRAALATALELGADLRRFYCYDRRLGDAAEALGIDVRHPGVG